ncbi:mannonate dehydratase [Sphingomonas sp. S1-29]|uniref:mannonate dehydratase n=1 Tax=Sphingomonas sp. S1-29 TaxID=2991074 RepID=UPI002240A3BB|nr:mannonate dehydratase [Sphingomonas sp. S1-29]UZK70411.1 mannonate dehydratase [Sphingomonas sp. S1-29]
MLMQQTMRWFGPSDPVGLGHIRQAGASGIVTALHEVPNGEVWPLAAIAERRKIIEAAGLEWSVVESLPVHEGLKQRSDDWGRLVAAYCESLRNLAAGGITVVTYNFMPLLDWTRTDLAFELPDGARALRFDWIAVAAYDIHILRRPGAEADYDDAVRVAAQELHSAMNERERRQLERNIIAGLPGSEASFNSVQFLEAINGYCDIDAHQLRANHHAFLRAVCPIAQEVGIRLVVHPDDPPFPIFGLPRVVSTGGDLDQLFAAVPEESNGLCFCTGSFGAREDNDLPGMVRRFGDRIGFLHLRSVQREEGRSFHEAPHLDGSAGMAEVVAAVHEISIREARSIPMRPDHGHQMLDDLQRKSSPGYSLLGRMRGLAELRGLERGVAYRAVGLRKV